MYDKRESPTYSKTKEE